MSEVEVVFADIVSTLSAELGGVPAACSRDLTLRETIERNQNAAIERARKSFNEKASAGSGSRSMSRTSKARSGNSLMKARGTTGHGRAFIVVTISSLVSHPCDG